MYQQKLEADDGPTSTNGTKSPIPSNSDTNYNIQHKNISYKQSPIDPSLPLGRVVS